MRKGLKTHEGSAAERRPGPLHLLFVCSRNRKRSPTAEALFSRWDGLEVSSAGLAPDAEELVSPETLEWADLVFVMEPAHHRRLQRQFGRNLRRTKVICLNIPDTFEFMDPRLVELLEGRVTPHLRSAHRL